MKRWRAAGAPKGKISKNWRAAGAPKRKISKNWRAAGAPRKKKGKNGTPQARQEKNEKMARRRRAKRGKHYKKLGISEKNRPRRLSIAKKKRKDSGRRLGILFTWPSIVESFFFGPDRRRLSIGKKRKRFFPSIKNLPKSKKNRILCFSGGFPWW